LAIEGEALYFQAAAFFFIILRLHFFASEGFKTRKGTQYKVGQALQHQNINPAFVSILNFDPIIFSMNTTL
jgi:hypothetical protein